MAERYKSEIENAVRYDSADRDTRYDVNETKYILSALDAPPQRASQQPARPTQIWQDRPLGLLPYGRASASSLAARSIACPREGEDCGLHFGLKIESSTRITVNAHRIRRVRDDESSIIVRLVRLWEV